MHFAVHQLPSVHSVCFSGHYLSNPMIYGKCDFSGLTYMMDSNLFILISVSPNELNGFDLLSQIYFVVYTFLK